MRRDITWVNACSFNVPRTVTLLDGTPVFSHSEAWRVECKARGDEAMLVLRMPFHERAHYLRVVEEARGKLVRERLEEAIWLKFNYSHGLVPVAENNFRLRA